jgi:UDP-N-acetylglucosamine:LPS N-acetylglucosamine transferase
MLSMILDSAIVICRPGYSTLMDLATLGKNAILIPTPGQTEQEYLAEYLMDKGFFYSVSQGNFDPEEAFRNSKSYGGIKINNDLSMLNWRIRNLLV